MHFKVIFLCFSLDSIAGRSVKDDMLIILGISERRDEAANVISGMKDAAIKLLQDELGLEVLLVEPQVKKDGWVDLQTPSANTVLLAKAGKNSLSSKPLSSTRRPVILQRLKVLRKSLNQWLQKRTDVISR